MSPSSSSYPLPSNPLVISSKISSSPMSFNLPEILPLSLPPLLSFPCVLILQVFLLQSLPFSCPLFLKCDSSNIPKILSPGATRTSSSYSPLLMSLSELPSSIPPSFLFFLLNPAYFLILKSFLLISQNSVSRLTPAPICSYCSCSLFTISCGWFEFEGRNARK